MDNTVQNIRVNGEEFVCNMDTDLIDEMYGMSSDTVRRKIDSLNISGEAKLWLFKVLDVVADLGGKALQLGRWVIVNALKLAERYPNTAFALIVCSILGILISQVPLIGAALGALLKPILLAFGLTMGFWNDMKSPVIDEIKGLGRRFQ